MAIRLCRNRLREGWSTSRCRTHLSHIKEFKIIGLLVPAVNIRVGTRPRVLNSRAPEALLTSEEYWLRGLNEWCDHWRQLFPWGILFDELELTATVQSWADI